MNSPFKWKSFLISSASNIIAAIVLIGTGWIIGNHIAIVSVSPENAAVMIAKKYESQSSGEYSAKLDRDLGKDRIYTVTRNEKEIAKVQISDFINLGWQEDSYLRL